MVNFIGMMDMARAHVVIRGLVQGVFFRATTRDRAIEQGVKGWVRNLPDGSVEALFEGRREDVEAIVRWCHKGPLGARVEKVEVEWQDYRGEFNGFEVRY